MPLKKPTGAELQGLIRDSDSSWGGEGNTQVPRPGVHSPELGRRGGWRGSRVRGSLSTLLHHHAAMAAGWPCPPPGRLCSKEPLLLRIPEQCWRSPAALSSSAHAHILRILSHTMGFSWALTCSSGSFPPLLIHAALGCLCFPPRLLPSHPFSGGLHAIKAALQPFLPGGSRNTLRVQSQKASATETSAIGQ